VDEWGRDERELVRRCKEGSEAAYAELVRQHRPRLFTLAYRLTSDRQTAEDVVQETFLAAFKAMERYEPTASLAAWMNAIAVRIAGRAASRQRARPGTSLDRIGGVDGDGRGSVVSEAALAELDPTRDPLAAVEAAELRRQLTEAVAALPFKYRAAVVLRFVVGLDYAEAAAALDVPLNTYKSHLLRGTRMLRQSLTATREGPRPEPESSAGPRDGRVASAKADTITVSEETAVT
jgi:RNA polymerase sigma-70 factor (ECF subfamily)